MDLVATEGIVGEEGLVDRGDTVEVEDQVGMVDIMVAMVGIMVVMVASFPDYLSAVS